MPRKAKSVKEPKVQPNSSENVPQPTLTEEQPAPEKTPPKERDAQGRFAAGNSGGPGNPHARHCARMLEIFRNAVSKEALNRIVCKLIEKAEAGDTSAAKILVSYSIGKPLPAPHPDSIDRDEWDHYQEDSMNQRELALVMNGLPTHVGNEIVRVALPIMTDVRTRDLAANLLKGCPKPRGEKTRARGEATNGNEPLANGDSSETDAASSNHTPPATPAFDPWDIDAAIAASSAQHEANEEHEIADEAQEEEAAPIANGKSNEKSVQPSTHLTPSTTAEKRSTIHDRRRTTKKPLPNRKNSKDSVLPSTRHPSPATTRTDDKKIDGKRIKKRAKALWLQPWAKQLNSN